MLTISIARGIARWGRGGVDVEVSIRPVNDKHVFVKLNKRKEENICRTSIQVNINVI